MTGGLSNARLASAAELVRQNAIFADIGTDHAYLPLFLLESGRINFAYCSDINEGPLASARKNAEERGMVDKMDFILTDGATVLRDRGITEIEGMLGRVATVVTCPNNSAVIDSEVAVGCGNVRRVTVLEFKDINGGIDVVATDLLCSAYVYGNVIKSE